MAERIIEYKLSAVDNASGVFQKAADNMKKIARTTETVEFAPIRKVTRTHEEQAVRNELASRAKEEREAVRNERVKFLADEKQFGIQLAQERQRQRQGIEADAIRKVTRTSGEQDIRNVTAARIKAMREGARMELAEIGAQQRLFGEARTPIRQVNRTAQEQAVRNEMAGRIKAMREASQRATVEAIANERLFGQKVAAEAKASGTTVVKGFFAGLKESFGKRSILGESLGILRGGGAIAGLGIAVSLAKNMTDQMESVVTQFRAGEKGAGELADQLIRSVPILGNIFSIGQSIRELITGEKGELAEIHKQAERIATTTNAIRDSWKAAADFAKQMAAERAKLDGTPEPGTGAVASGKSALEEEMARFIRERTKLSEEINRLSASVADAKGNASQGPLSVIPTVLMTRSAMGALAERQAKEANKKIADIEAQQALLEKGHQQNLLKIKEEAGATQASARDAFDRDAVKKAEELEQRLKEITKEGASQSATVKAEARAQALRALDKDYEAEIILIQDRLRREQELIQKRASEAMKVEGANPWEIDARRKLEEGVAKDRSISESDLAKHEQLERDKKLAEENRKKMEGDAKARQDIDEQLRKFHIESLEEEWKLDDRIVAKDLERLNIAKEYADRRREILAILKEEAISGDQRRQALGELANLDQLEASAMAKAARQNQPSPFSPQFARAETGRNLATSIAGPQHTLEQQQLKKQEEILRDSVKQTQLLQTLVDEVRNRDASEVGAF